MAIERKALLIEGMTCVNCQNRIEQALRNIAGISKVYVSYSKGQAEIEFDNDILTLDRIIAVIQNLDYKVVKKRKNRLFGICQSGSNICNYYFIVLSVTEIWHFESACAIDAC